MKLRIHRNIGLHGLDVFGEGGRWSAAVDGAVLPGRFRSQEEAREVGLGELERAMRDEGSIPSLGDSVEPPCSPCSWY
jgi:hypothetical protein